MNLLLNQLMKEKKTNSFRLSKKTGLSYATVYNLVNGQASFSKLNVHSAVLIARYLGTSVEKLYDDYEQNFTENSIPTDGNLIQ